MKTKYCKKCNKEKPLTEFWRDKAAVDGHKGACIECLKVLQPNIYNPVKAKLQRARFKKAHPDYYATHVRPYNEENKEKLRLNRKEYARVHGHKWKEANQELWQSYYESYIKEYRKDPAVKVRQNVATAVNRQIENGTYVKSNICKKCNKEHTENFCFAPMKVVNKILAYRKKHERENVPFKYYSGDLITLCKEHIYELRKEWKRK